MQRHLAFFVPSLAGGGAERVVLTLANYFAAQGHTVDLVLSRGAGAYEKELHPGVEVFLLDTPRRILATPKLAHYLRTRRPEAMLSTINNFAAVLAKRWARVPTRIVIREATTPSRALQAKQISKKGALVTRWGIRWLYPHADAVIAVSRGVAHDLQQLAPIHDSKLHVIYNPVLSDELLRKANAPLEHEWFQPDQPPVVLAAGRLIPLKGFDTLLQAFAQVVQTVDARLVILGEGDDRSRLTQIAQMLDIEARIDLPGFDPNPFRYMRRASVFVLSSRYEGLPNVLIQAMACGCPVVSTNCVSGPDEILDGGKYGELVPVDDVDAMAAAIRRVLGGERKTVPEAWLEQFRVEVAAGRYLQVMLPHRAS
ncbi:MAG: glycosyltransferase [Candidatus Caldarchaeum sp.]